VGALALASAALGFAGDGFGHFAERAERTRAGRPPMPALLPWSLNETAWLSGGLDRFHRLRLAPAPTLSLIGRYQHPWENHTPEWRTFFDGRYGLEHAPAPSLTWRLPEALLPLSLPVIVTRPCPHWKAPRPLAVARYAGESEYMPLFDCDGAIAPDVLDRLSVLARAPETPRPAIPLPEDPAPARVGEWLPGLRLLDPRLVWVLGEIQGAFPKRRVVIMSGYRPDAHTSFHKRGKALDLYVEGIPTDALFTFCRTLRDVGCGFYPNNVFVHFDVRPFGTGKVTWVDVAEPGGVSRYVDGWPGVLPAGTAWLGG
jgi:Bacterial protein of unknown function (DUF882)